MHSAPIALLATNNKFVQGPSKTDKKMNSPMGMPDTWRQIAAERKDAEARAMSTISSDDTSSVFSEDLKAKPVSSKPSKLSKLKSILKGNDEQPNQQQPQQPKPAWKTILTGEVYKHHPMYRLEESLHAQSLKSQVQPKSL